MTVEQLRAEVAAAARALARAGLVEGFGHVSARAGDLVVLTSTRPLFRCAASDTLVLDATGGVLDGPADAQPLERFLHLAVYAARPDVGAICRGHGPWLVTWGTGTEAVPVRHGLGLLAGARVGVHDDPLLISDPARAAAAAASLAGDRCLLLRGNGGFATGAGPAQAAAVLYALEERCRVARQATGDPVDPTLWQYRELDTAVELARHTAWFSARFDGARFDDRTTPDRTTHDREDP